MVPGIGITSNIKIFVVFLLLVPIHRKNLGQLYRKNIFEYVCLYEKMITTFMILIIILFSPPQCGVPKRARRAHMPKIGARFARPLVPLYSGTDLYQELVPLFGGTGFVPGISTTI